MHAPQLARTLQHFNNRIRRNIIYARLSKLTTLPSTSTKLHVRLSTLFCKVVTSLSCLNGRCHLHNVFSRHKREI